MRKVSRINGPSHSYSNCNSLEIETLDHKIEKLSRKDEEVARALEEKQKIIADIFNIPPEDYETITDLVVGGDNSKDAKDVLLAVMAQADCLARLVRV